jgi:hypothetical protein
MFAKFVSYSNSFFPDDELLLRESDHIVIPDDVTASNNNGTEICKIESKLK